MPRWDCCDSRPPSPFHHQDTKIPSRAFHLKGTKRLFQNPRELRRGERREVQGTRRRRASTRAVDDERCRNSTPIAPPRRGCDGEGPSAASDLLDDPLEVVCVGLPCIRPLGTATVATRVLKQPLSSWFGVRSEFGSRSPVRALEPATRDSSAPRRLFLKRGAYSEATSPPWFSRVPSSNS